MRLTASRASPEAGRTSIYAAVLALFTAIFAGLGAATLFWEDAAELDVRFVSWVHETSPAELVDLMQIVTYAGSGLLLGPVAVVAAVAFMRRGRAGAALFVLAALVGSQVLDQLLKAGFRRTRPELDDPFLLLTTYSFPSGHAFNAAAMYGALALVLASASSRRTRVAILVAGAALTALVAASRVILGVHYLGDVIAGWLLGTVVAVLIALPLLGVARAVMV